MNAGPSQPMSTSKLVLIASIAYTLAAYATFTGLWGIVIDPRLLLVVIGVQLAMLQLGGTRVLTGLGAAYLAALLAVAALFAAVFLLFPASKLYRSAASASGAVTILFILFSFVTAFREPISVPDATKDTRDPGVLFEDEETASQTESPGEGVGRREEGGDTQEEIADEGVEHESLFELPEEPVTEYEFDDLSDEKLEISLAGDSIESPSQSPVEEPEFPSFELPESFKVDVSAASEGADDGLPNEGDEPDQPGHPDQADTVIPDIWEEEAAWTETQTQTQTETETEELQEVFSPVGEPEQAAGESGNLVSTGHVSTGTPSKTPEPLLPDPVPSVEEKPSSPDYPQEYRMRTHYRVLDSGSGELYGVYYGDEGYASLDLVSLGALLSEKIGSSEISIVKLDWTNFDEVEVHVQKPRAVDPESVDQLPADEPGGSGDDVSSEIGYPREMAGPADGDVPEDVPEEVPEEVPAEGGSEMPRYFIYDRRTIQPMKEYVPEGNRPRIDRLTLYKLFPEYDFKTFEIDSIRWHEDEVRIFIRGEKKQSPKSKVQSPKG